MKNNLNENIVKIYTRNINGVTRIRAVCWGDIYAYVKSKNLNLEEEEILMVTVNDSCIYSQLGSAPITWNELIGFFA